MSYSLAFSQAIAIVTYVAIKIEHGVYEFVPTRELAQVLDIPVPSAVKLLQSLSSAGIIETREGAKGGVRLAQAAAKVTLLDVFKAIERDRPLFRIDIKLRLTNAEADMARQRLRAVFERSEHAMKEQLRATTIADLYHKN